DAQLFRDDLLDALFDVVHYPSEGKSSKIQVRAFYQVCLLKKARSRHGSAPASEALRFHRRRGC
ncbi:hypothetical protein, partial [Trinickia sp.]|uniref:hypothetical protein n=1 Tax=Trinickia sp. TaxID=2571163 RepID=UPI003F7FFA9B